MKKDSVRGLIILSLVLAFAGAGQSQQSAFTDPLLDHFTGTWVLRGTIGGQETVHEVVAEWVLGHQYLRFHEVSREKDPKGQPAYEAIVFIGWDQPSGEYACLWLDSTGGGGLTGQAIGKAKRGDDEIPVVFALKDGGSFHTTFAYDRKADAWEWRMDEKQKGLLTPFARLRMTRA
jgi:hypothetical protein